MNIINLKHVKIKLLLISLYFYLQISIFEQKRVENMKMIFYVLVFFKKDYIESGNSEDINN